MQPEAPKFDPLIAFMAWYQAQQFNVPVSIADGVRRVGAFSGLTLYRDDRFQVQMWICDPDSEIPDHSHPNVDSIQVYISGQVYLRLNGEIVIKPSDVGTICPSSFSSERRSPKNGFWIRVRPTDTHGASVGCRGGAFMTFQHFLRTSPCSVELNWIGEPLSPSHEATLTGQNLEVSQ